MYYLLRGKDTYRSREKLSELVSHFKTKVSDLGFFEMDDDNFSEAGFEELLKTKNLFEKKYIVACEKLLESKQSFSFVASNLEACAKSENVFLFWEEELDKELLEKAESLAAKTQNFELLSGANLSKWYAEKKLPFNISETVKKECGADLWRAEREIEKYKLGGGVQFVAKVTDYNPFAICDAFGARDKKKAWVIFRQAVMRGIPAEEVFFKVSWEIKNLLAVKKLMNVGSANVAKEAGLHTFVAGKAMKDSKNFTEEELMNYSSKIVDIYHGSRMGEGEMEIEFEKMLIA